MSLGDSWTYDQTSTQSTGPFTGYASVSAAANANRLGQSTTAFSMSSTTGVVTPLTSYYAASGGGITYYGNDDSSDPVTPQIVPYAQLLFPVQAGPLSTVQANGIGFGTAANGHALTTSFVQSLVVADLETVTVSAGVFPNSAKLVQTLTGTATDTVAGTTVPYSATETTWLAPGIGIVKDVTTQTVNGTSTGGDSVSLRGYTVGGVAHGLGQAFIQNANLNTAADGIAVASASSGSTFLTVLGQGTGGPILSLTALLTDAAGTLLHSIPLGMGSEPSVTFDGTNYEVVFVSWNPSYQVVAQRISTSGAQLDGAGGYVAATVGSIGGVTIVAGSTNEMVLFESTDTSLAPCICAVFLSPSGTPPASGVVTLEHASPTSFPTAAFDGSNYLVVWSEAAPSGTSASPIYAARVSQSGAVVDPTPLLVTNASPYQSSPQVAFDATNYFIVWLDGRHAASSTDTNREIYGSRVSTAGGTLSLLDGPADSGGILVSTGPLQQRLAPVLAFNGVEYIVAWPAGSGAGYVVPSGTGIAAARVAKSGSVSSGVGFEISVASSGFAGGSQNETFFSPGISSNGGATMIDWLEDGGNVANPAITQLSAVLVAPF